MPAEPGVMKAGMACLMVGVVEDPHRWWAWAQATEFYRYLKNQLSSMITLEEVRVPKTVQKTGKPSEARDLPGRPTIRDGRVSKRHLRRAEKKKGTQLTMRNREGPRRIRPGPLNRSEDRSRNCGGHVR
ncbi:hypothetical protein Aduo_019062 [Ancylostoma duodenale]